MYEVIDLISDPSFYWILSVICFALFVRGAFGFGDGLIAVPLLSLSISVKVAVPLILLLSIATSITGLLRERASVQLGSLKRAGTVALISFPLGIFLLSLLDELLVRKVLGVLLLLLAVWALWIKELPRLVSPWWSYLFGFFAGILGGAYALRGIVFGLYGSFRGWSSAQLRSTLHGFYLLSGLLIPVGFWSAGLLTQQLLWLALVLLVPAVLSAKLGHWTAQHLDEKGFKKALWILVAALGLNLIQQSFE